MKSKSLGIFMLLMLCYNTALSAEANTGQEAQEPGEENSSELAIDSEESEPLEVGDSEVEDDPESSPNRVIPTEQISQDLGVSFPVDI